MKSIRFKQQNAEIAKDQEEYQTLYACVDEEKTVARFVLDEKELAQIRKDGEIWISILNRGEPLQPIGMNVLNPYKREPEVKVVGFDKVANDLKKKYEKLAKMKGYSSVSLLCAAGYKESEKGKYSGGVIGDMGAILEGLFYMAKRRPEVKELIQLCASALLTDEENSLKDKETSVSKLLEYNLIPDKLFSVLDKNSIFDINELSKFTREEVKKWDGLGKKSIEIIDEIMKVRNLKFKIK